MADDVVIQTPGRTVRSAQIFPRNPIKKELGKGQLTASSTTLYTAPAAPTTPNPVGINPVTELTEIWICNTDSVSRTFTLYIIESGGSVADDRAIFKAASLTANQTILIETQTYIEASGTIRGLADSASKVTYRFSGIEYT